MSFATLNEFDTDDISDAFSDNRPIPVPNIVQ